MTSSARLRLLLLLCAVCGARVVPASIVKPFWHDEIYTILMSRLPTLADTWSAAREGVDLSPPLNVWITRGVQAIAGVGQVTTRLPPLGGFMLAVCCLFLLLLRRIGVIGALSGALLPFVTAGLRFASEARPYGLMIGFSALSLYAWMEAASDRARGRNLTLLAFSMAASIWNHYFGVLVLAPIVVGECVRVARERRVDRGVALAVAAGLIAAMPLYRLAMASASQRTTFWARASWGQLPEAYAFVLNALWSVPAAIVAATIALVILFWPRRILDADSSPRMIPGREAAAIAAALAIPLLAIAMARLVAGVFIPRYALSAVPGIAAAIPLAIWRVNVRRSPAAVLLCLALACTVVADTWGALRTVRQGAIDPIADRAVLIESLRGPAPTVMSSSLQFLQLWYYLPAPLKPRLMYLADPQIALQRTKSDTIDRGYLALGARTAVSVLPFETFVARHSSFRVYEAGSGWLLDELQARGAVIEEIGRDPAGRLYQVSLSK